MLSSFSDCKRNLVDGNLAVLPTETVYGLAANGLKSEAVNKIFELKGRPANNPVILHISGLDESRPYAIITKNAEILAERFWPGPLTLLLNKKNIVPGNVTASLNTVGIRSPSNKVFRKMLNELAFPLAAPSANPSNRTSPTTSAQVLEMFGSDCPPVLDDGQTALGLESTVIDLTSKVPTILRPGHVTTGEIEDCLSSHISTKHDNLKSGKFPHKSPGNNFKHYSPKTPTMLHRSLESCIKSNELHRNELVLVYSQDAVARLNKFECTTWSLSEKGILEEVGRSLFKSLHEADTQNFKKIHLILLVEGDDLSLAINDRITRACAKQD